MSHLHTINGQCALACGDMDGAQVEFNIVLHLLKESPTDFNAHTARIWLRQIELCQQSPSSCLALIQNAEKFILPKA